MAFDGKLTRSRRKRDFNNERNTAFAPKRLEFAHQMNAGDTDINLNALVLPMSMPGFTNASTPDLLAAHIYAYKSNLSLKRSDGGALIPYMEYIVVSDNTIRLLSPALAGTVIYGTVNSSPSSGTVAVDGFQIVATGTLGVGQVDVVVGMPFQLFANPSQQVGAVLVFRNGRLMYRNDGNVTANPSAPGNYQELPTGVGVTNTIRFNRPGVTLGDGSPESYTVISNGLVALMPTASMFGVLDSLGGQIDKIIQVLSAVSGDPESFFQSNPNQVDLRVFGDRVIALEDLTEQHARFGQTGGAASFGSVNTGTYVWPSIVINAGDSITPVVDTSLGSYFLINKTGLYSIFLVVRNSQNGGQWIMKNIPSPASTAPSADNPNLIAYSFNDQVTNAMPMSNTVHLNVGDKIFSGNDATGTNNGLAFFEITRVR